MAEFVKIELTFHAKALEMYTQCYQSLRTQSQQDDLQVCALFCSLMVCWADLDHPLSVITWAGRLTNPAVSFPIFETHSEKLQFSMGFRNS